MVSAGDLKAAAEDYARNDACMMDEVSLGNTYFLTDLSCHGCIRQHHFIRCLFDKNGAKEELPNGLVSHRIA